MHEVPFSPSQSRLTRELGVEPFLSGSKPSSTSNRSMLPWMAEGERLDESSTEIFWNGWSAPYNWNDTLRSRMRFESLRLPRNGTDLLGCFSPSDELLFCNVHVLVPRLVFLLEGPTDTGVEIVLSDERLDSDNLRFSTFSSRRWISAWYLYSSETSLWVTSDERSDESALPISPKRSKSEESYRKGFVRFIIGISLSLVLLLLLESGETGDCSLGVSEESEMSSGASGSGVFSGNETFLLHVSTNCPLMLEIVFWCSVSVDSGLFRITWLVLPLGASECSVHICVTSEWCLRMPTPVFCTGSCGVGSTVSGTDCRFKIGDVSMGGPELLRLSSIGDKDSGTLGRSIGSLLLFKTPVEFLLNWLFSTVRSSQVFVLLTTRLDFRRCGADLEIISCSIDGFNCLINSCPLCGSRFTNVWYLGKSGLDFIGIFVYEFVGDIVSESSTNTSCRNLTPGLKWMSTLNLSSACKSLEVSSKSMKMICVR